MSWKIEFQIICFQTNLHLENQFQGSWRSCGVCSYIVMLTHIAQDMVPVILSQYNSFCLLSFGDWKPFIRLQNIINLGGKGGVPLFMAYTEKYDWDF